MVSPNTSPIAAAFRRIPASLLVAAFVGMLLTSCGSAEVELVDATGIKAVWVYNGGIDEAGWNFTHEQARIIANDTTGATTFAVEDVPLDGPDFEEIVSDLIITDGVNMVFATAFEHQNAMERLAADFPEVIFQHANGFKRNDTNFGNYYGRMYEPRYLAGMAAASASSSGRLGYVAGLPFPEVVRGINAFALGAQLVNPNATVEIVWTNASSDPAVEANASRALLDIGVDVIATHQDSAASGEVAQQGGVRWVGFDTDQRSVAPTAFLAATLFHWDQYYIDLIEAVATERYEPASFWGGLDEGTVSLTDLVGLDEEAVEVINKESERIGKGDRTIFAGPLVDQSGSERVADGEQLSDDDLRRMNWLVDGVIGALPN